MAITFQAAGTLCAAAGNITVTWPTHQAGDYGILLIECQTGDTPTLSTSGGFTLIAQINNTSTPTTRLQVYGCVASSGSMTSPITTGITDHAAGVILTYRGVDLVSPANVSATATGQNNLTLATVTTTKQNCRVLLILGYGGDNAGPVASDWANANLTEITERFDGGTTLGNGGGVAIADGGFVGPGATGTSTAYSAYAYCAMVTLALAPGLGGNQVVWFA